MSFNWRKYASVLWSSIKDRVVQDATRDQSEKVSLLARDLYLYVQELEKRLEQSQAVFNTAGVTIIVTGAACPTGWVEDTTWRNRFLQGPDAGGGNIGTTGSESITIAGAGSHSHSIPMHRHTISTGGSHEHDMYEENISYASGGTTKSVVVGGYFTYSSGSHDHGGYTGYYGPDVTDIESNHVHSASGITPAFKRALFCKKA